MAERQTPLYVRLAADQARRLDQAVSASGKTKRQLVEDAVREHVTDAGLVVGRVALREDEPEVLTVGEAAALLRVDESQLVEAAQRGELPARRIVSVWRFSRTALLSWLHGNGLEDSLVDRDGSLSPSNPDQVKRIPARPGSSR